MRVGQPHLPPPPLLDPAWYPDPTGRYEARYWDGRKWTSHISHYGATGADPLLRARFDRWWIRGFLRLALWAAILGAGYWAFENYWPTNERDYDADEQLASVAVLVLSDMPDATWSVSTASVSSPLDLELDEDGAVSGITACEQFASVVEDALDEPRRLNAFESANGLTGIAHSTTVGADPDVGRSYLGTLREPESGECLGVLWGAELATPDEQLTLATTLAMDDPAFGDEAVWWRLDGNLQDSGSQTNVFVDYVVVRVDRVVTEYAFTGYADTVPVDLQRDVIQLETERIRSLLAAIERDADTDSDTDETEADAGDDE